MLNNLMLKGLLGIALFSPGPCDYQFGEYQLPADLKFLNTQPHIFNNGPVVDGLQFTVVLQAPEDKSSQADGLPEGTSLIVGWKNVSSNNVYLPIKFNDLPVVTPLRRPLTAHLFLKVGAGSEPLKAQVTTREISFLHDTQDIIPLAPGQIYLTRIRLNAYEVFKRKRAQTYFVSVVYHNSATQFYPIPSHCTHPITVPVWTGTLESKVLPIYVH